MIELFNKDALQCYEQWDAPMAIISDGAYGLSGFKTDVRNSKDLVQWYLPHVEAWSKLSTPQTTLWFWNTEIGWANVHPVLERFGWKYCHANIWNKGKKHMAGNVNTATIRSFPAVTEMCVQYVREAKQNGASLQEWLHAEWERTGLPFRLANIACGVKSAATRKYLDLGDKWYFPPEDMFEKLRTYADVHGNPKGRPYFKIDGAERWAHMRAKFKCPFGFSNVWDRPPLKSPERIVVKGGKTAHLNQKPLDLISMIVQASTDAGDVVWEPFGGLFTAALACLLNGRKCFSSEIETEYFQIGKQRIEQELKKGEVK